MSRHLDPHLQRIIDNAGLVAHEAPQSEFSFPPMETHTGLRSFRQGPRRPFKENVPLNDSIRDSYSYDYTNDAVRAASTASRVSLVPRNMHHRRGQEPHSVHNADPGFRITQNQHQGLSIGRDAPTMNNTLAQSSLDQLATNMLLQRPIPQPSPEHASLFRGLRSNRLNQLQPQRQQVTPPFNLSGYIHTPNTQRASRLSPPLQLSSSSPTTRVSLRRLSKGNGRSPVRPGEDHDFDEYTESFETPQRQSVPISEATMKRTPQALALRHAPPMAHGIQLISPQELPDRFRQVFPHELFNAVQSKCFASVYKSNDNVVVSAPTGCGKTAILELAICKLVESQGTGEFKIIYQAPTKSLCSERMRDWQKKFSHLNLPCAELTGETSQYEMSRIRNSSIIVTTPEKWDSITRKWQDHVKLLQMVKLFLIDEVHILKDARGATLEAVVSRMKSSGANVRFIALSATVPNSEDIALWLGRDPTTTHLPAHREAFGEDFRPVKLQKHVYGYEGQMNDFAFEKVLDGKLPGLIQKHTRKKPIMVFCFTRKSCENTAALLAEWWMRQKVDSRAWPGPIQPTAVLNKELQELVGCGVAFHHAGLDSQDRNTIENAFLRGNINVICCTSTLAVGVNLPCHLVVLKGTVGFQDGGLGEYSDLEVMQMLGRAGRPQFDDSAIAIIMTRLDKAQRYKMMVSGQEILESTLHLKLIEHLNSEIGLGTVYSLETARKWLSGTFLTVRMNQNPDYYKLEGIATSKNADERLRLVCERDVKLLQQYQLVSEEERFRCTEYGHAMSRYMVQFDTMKLLLSLPKHANTEQILQTICQASEFKDLRMKPNERPVLREFNKSPLIKYPIKENISTTPQKISLIIQVQLGGIEFPSEKGFLIIKRQFLLEKGIVFERTQRLVRCIIDCKSVDCDATSTRHALDLARSLSAEYWENSNLQLRQVPQIGPAASRKLVSQNINSVEELANLDTASIERIMNRNPPFGNKILESLLGFPCLNILTDITGKATLKSGENPKVMVKAKLGFTNFKTPVWNGKKPSLTFTAATSNGILVHFWRGNIQKLDKMHEVKFTVELSSPDDEIMCYVACDEIVGTSRSSLLKPDIPASAFPVKQQNKYIEPQTQVAARDEGFNMTDEFGDDDFEDNELLEVVKHVDAHGSEYGSDEFADIDDLIETQEDVASKKEMSAVAVEPVQMENGKWTCNHQCRGGQTLKNGLLCKHKCCHKGIDKPRKHRRRTFTAQEDWQTSTTKLKVKDRKLIKKPSQFAGLQLVGSKSHGARSQDDEKLDMKIFQRPQKLLKLKEGKLDQAAEEVDMEIVNLADELSPASYGVSCTSNFCSGKSVRLPKRKPGFSYSNGQQPDLPFLHKADIDDHIFHSGNSDHEGDFHSPSVLLNADVDHGDPFESYQKNHTLTPSPYVSVSVEAAMSGLSDPAGPRTPAPRVDLSFENRVFDFSAFNEQPEEQFAFSSPLTHAGLKRPRSGTPELPQRKCRRIQKVELIMNEKSSVQESEPLKPDAQQRSTPAWVDEFDAALINDLKGIVDFVD